MIVFNGQKHVVKDIFLTLWLWGRGEQMIPITAFTFNGGIHTHIHAL